MSTNLVNAVAHREAERARAEWGDLGPKGIPGIQKMVAPIVADVLDLLSQDGRFAAPVEPGPCWADSGFVWPGRDISTRCDLRAGHAGAHEADRGSMGGTAVWTDAEAFTATHNEPAASAAAKEDA